MPRSLLEYHAHTARVRRTVSGELSRYWSSMGSWRDADVDRFVRVAVPRVQAGQLAVAYATADRLGGRVDRKLVLGSRAVDPREEYRRPAVSLYTALSEGKPLPDAVRAGVQRLTSLALTDMQVALVSQSRESLRTSRFTHFRRVLTGFENCELCRLAAGHKYTRDDLLPIHGSCDCTVEPVYEDAPAPPVDVSGLQLTDARRQQLADGAAPESLVAVHEHGELGPVLAWASDEFTGPSDF